MAPEPTTRVTRFICSSKRCLKVFRSFAVRKKKPTEEAVTPEDPVGFGLRLRKESYYFSSASLSRGSTSSIDTCITLLDEPLTCHQENRLNEQLEKNSHHLLCI